MKVMELYIQPAKREAPLSVREITLINSFGVKGDCHGGGKRQLSLWDYEAKKEAEALGFSGLCMKKFSANILLSGLNDAMPSPGDALKIADTKVIITQSGKSCFPDDCSFAAKTADCPVQRCAYATIEQGGVIKVGDEAWSIPRNEDRG